MKKQLEGSVAHRFVHAFDGLIRQLIVPNSHKAAQNLQLGPQDVRALTWLGSEGLCLMTEFAKGVGVPLSTATHLANRLVAKGVVLRERSEQDRRVVLIGLSKQGKTLESQLFQLRLARGQGLLKRLAPAEQQQLVALIQKALSETSAQPPNCKKEEAK